MIGPFFVSLAHRSDVGLICADTLMLFVDGRKNMQADKVLRAIIRKSGLSVDGASLKIGKSKSYLSVTFARGSIPKLDTMADACSRLGWDLIARDRSDGFEIRIDPPCK